MSDQPPDALWRVWTIGDYPVIARHLLPISVETLEEANEADDGSCILPSPYLLATARRS